MALLGTQWYGCAVSQLFNTLVALDDTAAAGAMGGIPDVTISAHCGVALLEAGHPRSDKLFGRLLNFVRRGHCFAAIIDDLARARAAVALLEPYEERAHAALNA